MDAPLWSFLIVAGGSGSRLGGIPKQFRRLGGRPVWQWSADTAERLRRAGRLCDIVLVVPAERCDEIKDMIGKRPITITEGGATRAASVLNGLERCRGSHVLIHDGARPFITARLCERLMDGCDECGASVPLLPCPDSLKKITEGSIECADRKLYYRTQTPQAFKLSEIRELLTTSELVATDEAGLWLESGNKIAKVTGDEMNFKITTKFDWEIAAAMAEKSIEKRTGHGYDIHQLVEGRRLVIAGVEIENAGFGLLGHSDADIVVHTVMDALLGAAGEPDIGTLFPASDDKWKNADSIELLHTVLELLASKGWMTEWADVTLIAQKPRMGDLVPSFIKKMNLELGAEEGKKLFNIKIKSAEHCGSAGRGECMICHGVATISRIQQFDPEDRG